MSAAPSPSAASADPSASSTGDNVAACVAARTDTNKFSPLLNQARTAAARTTVLSDWSAALHADAAKGGLETDSGLDDLATIVASWPTTADTPGTVALTAYATGLNDVCSGWVK